MWDQVYGDRRQEIVFIGAELDEAALRQRLDDCLVSEMAEQDMPVKDWSQLPDPFPAWKRAESNA